MSIKIRAYCNEDVAAMNKIWNGIVTQGNAFPQTELLDETNGETFFGSQTYCGVAENTESNEITGLYILHPNNVGRCSHIANASYAVSSKFRGRGIGEMLVKDCLVQAKLHGFKILQFNAVVKTNTAARKLYEKLGFIQLGTIKQGFLMKGGSYEDICPYYITL